MAKAASCWWRTAKAARCFPRSRPTPQACRRATTAPSSKKVFAEKKPVYSNLFFGAVKKRLIVTVEVPVIRDGEVALRHLLQPADRDFPGHDRAAASGQGLDDLDLRRRRHQFRPRAESAGYDRQAGIAFALCGDVPHPRSDLRDGVARRRAADHERIAILPHRLDGRCRGRGEFAGGAAVAQPRDHQRDGRRFCCWSALPLRCGWRRRSRAAKCSTIC